ncbi:MAG: hypothetical protein V2A34_03880 [Lentisphaerota bacterium]
MDGSKGNEAPAPLTRRDFFKKILPRPKAATPAVPEEPVVPGRFSLGALKFLPDPVLQQIVPVLRQGWTVTFQDDGVAYKGEVGKEGVVFLSSEGCAAVRKFDGRQTLEQIALALDLELGRTPGSGFPLVREAFLALTAREIYHPVEPPRGF